MAIVITGDMERIRVHTLAGDSLVDLKAVTFNELSGGNPCLSTHQSHHCVPTSHGIYAFDSTPSGPVSTRLIPWNTPIDSICITGYHYVLTSQGITTIISRISHQPIQSTKNSAIGVSCDSRDSGVFWMWGNGGRVWRGHAAEEDRDVWRLSLEKAMRGESGPGGFDDAATACRSASQRSVVNHCRALSMIEKGGGKEAMEWLARSPRSLVTFAEGMRMAKTEDDKRFYVLATLERLHKSLPSSSVKLPLLGAYAVELLLAAREEGGAGDGTVAAFLARHSRELDAGATLQVMRSHGTPPHEVAAACAATGDAATAAQACLEVGGKRGADAALKVLAGAPVHKAAPAYARHAGELFSLSPEASSSSLLSRYEEGLDPVLMIPGLVDLPPSEAIASYTGGCIAKGCKKPAIHNLYVRTLASAEDEGPLFRYVSGEVPDPAFALGEILKSGRHKRSAVKVYMKMDLPEEAVKLALKVDEGLARELAGEAGSKELWMMVAADAAERGEGVDDVLDVVKASGVLSIEDVLNLLPDFTAIDRFKTEICSALNSYSDRIRGYKDDLAEGELTCDSLSEEIEMLSESRPEVPRDAKCALTGKKLEKGMSFYMFPSGYAVCDTALRSAVWPHLSEAQQGRVVDIEMRMAELKISDAVGEEREREQEDFGRLQKELDGLIAAECPLTGDVMIESLGVPLEGWDDTE